MAAEAKFFYTGMSFYNIPEGSIFDTVQEAWIAMPAELQKAFTYKRAICTFEYNYIEGKLIYSAEGIGEYVIEDLERYT